MYLERYIFSGSSGQRVVADIGASLVRSTMSATTVTYWKTLSNKTESTEVSKMDKKEVTVTRTEIKEAFESETKYNEFRQKLINKLLEKEKEDEDRVNRTRKF